MNRVRSGTSGAAGNRAPIPREVPMSLLAELWALVRTHKKYALLLLLLVMLVFGGLLVFTPPVLAPFIYTMFGRAGAVGLRTPGQP